MLIRAEEVKAARDARGWSQHRLAQHIGCTQATISRIESGAKFSKTIAKAVERLLVENREDA